jgi:glyoxylase-like metal-dependent hydrolase (beta-lactamase superfamily II)
VLRQLAADVLIHESAFCQSNTVIVQGSAGVLLIDPGIQEDEMVALASDLRDLGQPVVAGFSTHPHWDHLLWHSEFGEVPRYGTDLCAATIAARLSDPNWRAFIAKVVPPDIADQIPLDLFGAITGLPTDAVRIPWEGTTIRIIEHQAHAPGHAALLIEDSRVLVAGDMLSDVLMPMLDFMNSTDPVEDYFAALHLFESLADRVDVMVPGHGSVCGTDQFRTRIEQDRAYLQALQAGGVVEDSRIGPSAVYDWVPSVHERQRALLGTS